MMNKNIIPKKTINPDYEDNEDNKNSSPEDDNHTFDDYLTNEEFDDLMD